jgi:phosphotransferase system IIB component
MFKPEVLIPVIIGVIILVVVISVWISANKKKTINKQYSEKVQQIINNLGGNDNIISVTPKMSRVEFVLKNYDIINKDELKNLGVQGVSKTSQKITLVVGNELALYIEKSFKGSN